MSREDEAAIDEMKQLIAQSSLGSPAAEHIKNLGPAPRKKWFDIAPEDAVDIVLPQPDIAGPVNEVGKPCPWPWDPQQLVGQPLGQYHCPYCGAMVMAGMAHLDYGPLCDGVERSPNTCRCPCQGCRYHCGAHTDD